MFARTYALFSRFWCKMSHGSRAQNFLASCYIATLDFSQFGRANTVFLYMVNTRLFIYLSSKAFPSSPITIRWLIHWSFLLRKKEVINLKLTHLLRLRDAAPNLLPDLFYIRQIRAQLFLLHRGTDIIIVTTEYTYCPASTRMMRV